ncbi:MAG: mannitol dehydrogenase [Ruminococcaceae bacterium]|nr:mannitol dehydrogenase [Oscillospiraceae bacterium]
MRAVMYGAGNIGRGFIGLLLSQSGYKVSFVDVNEAVIRAMNEAHRYPVDILLEEGTREDWVENIDCVDGKDPEAVAAAIAAADVMATAVGVNILKFIAAPIAGGLKKRWSEGNLTPFNIIICENLIGADRVLRDLIAQNLDAGEVEKLDSLVGFVEASIGRMVPVQTPEMQKGNPLRVCVEAYDKLPLDKAAVKGDFPPIKNVIWYTPFEFYIERKLYIHNMGHAMTAYLGDLLGCEYIWQAIENPTVELMVIRAMTASAIALAKRHGDDAAPLFAHVQDLIRRFANRGLGDTVKRVGGDLRRKLSPGDRLVGALKMCREQGVDSLYIEAAIAAALCFRHDDLAEEKTPAEILRDISTLEDAGRILAIYDRFKSGESLEAVLVWLKQEAER